MRFSLTFYILSALSSLLVLTWILLSLISFKTAENDLLALKGEEGRLQLASIAELLPRPLAAPEPGGAAARSLGVLAKKRGFAGLLRGDGAGKTLYAFPDHAAPAAGFLNVLKPRRNSV